MMNRKDVRVLVGCEYSQVIMPSFLEAGFDAYSCDILPCEGDYPERHIQEDLLKVISDKWNLLIAHPPCTYISYAAKSYWDRPGRAIKRLEALMFFAKVLDADVKHICVENPMGCADHVVRKHDQIIHPYHFWDNDMKRTCLWLKNLPPLVHLEQDDLFGTRTHADKPEPIYVGKSGRKMYFTDAITGTGKGGHKRSRSFEGIASAMAEQWGNYITNSK